MYDCIKSKRMNVTIEDKLQQNFKFNEYSLVRDIVVFGVCYVMFLYIPFEAFARFLKYYVIVIIVRYILSELTTIRLKDNKKYFQLSGHMSLFMLAVLTAADNNVLGLQNKLVQGSLLIAYGMLNVVVGSHTTVDIVYTYIAVLFLYNLQILKNIL